jgi:hypothetical protein
MFGGHLAVIDMVHKQLSHVWKEPFLCSGGVTFNTNDSMVASGNDNGDVTVRSLLEDAQEVRLSHFEKDLSNKCEVT